MAGEATSRLRLSCRCCPGQVGQARRPQHQQQAGGGLRALRAVGAFVRRDPMCQRFQTLMCKRSPRTLVKMQVLIQEVWSGELSSAFLTSSQVVLALGVLDCAWSSKALWRALSLER